MIESPSSQSKIIIARCLAVIGFAGLAKVIVYYHTIDSGSIAHLFELLLDALIIAAIIAGLGETRLFKSYLEERLKSYAKETSDAYGELLKNSFHQRAIDVDALRSTYDPKVLREIERAVQRASLASNPHPDIDELLTALNAMRDNISVWRHKWWQRIIYEESDRHPDKYLMKCTLKMKYINSTNEPKPLPLTAFDVTYATTDADDTPLYKLTTMEFNGKDVLGTQQPTMSQEKGRTTFETKIPDQLPPTPRASEGTPLLECAEVLYGKGEPFVQTFVFPVKGFELLVDHPKEIIPALYVFGIGGSAVTDPLEPERESTELQHRWIFSGWMLQSSGYVLTFSRTNDQRTDGPASARTTAKTAANESGAGAVSTPAPSNRSEAPKKA